jgi:hypothetical protein
MILVESEGPENYVCFQLNSAEFWKNVVEELQQTPNCFRPTISNKTIFKELYVPSFEQ